MMNYKQAKGKLKVGTRVQAVEGAPNNCSELSGARIQEITEVNERTFRINNCLHGFDDDTSVLTIVSNPCSLVVSPALTKAVQTELASLRKKRDAIKKQTDALEKIQDTITTLEMLV